jgi:cation-transporting ATPase E
LKFEEQIRPEAKEAVRAFTDSGVQVKILSSDDPARVLTTAGQIGLNGSETDSQAAVSGFQMVQMDESQIDSTAEETAVFGQLTPGQKSQIVTALRRQEERVAMMGDAVDDIAAMEEANLSITMQRGSQAALSMADVVLLGDSLQLLPTVLQRGQFIVNGMLDILKINLAQIGYIVLLIVVMLAGGKRIFFYHPTQGGVIAFFTVIIPSLGLTFWASSGAVPRQYSPWACCSSSSSNRHRGSGSAAMSLAAIGAAPTWPLASSYCLSWPRSCR